MHSLRGELCVNSFSAFVFFRCLAKVSSTRVLFLIQAQSFFFQVGCRLLHRETKLVIVKEFYIYVYKFKEKLCLIYTK